VLVALPLSVEIFQDKTPGIFWQRYQISETPLRQASFETE
jgi:hypothetical protein